MAFDGESSTFATLFHGLGYALEELGPLFPGKGGAVAAAPDRAGEAPGAGGAEPAAPPDDEVERVETGDRHPVLEEVGTVAAVAAGSWVLTRLLRPKSISWPRAVLAGLAGTALYDLTHLIERRVLDPDGADNSPDEPAADALVRYAAGLGTAVAYAAVLYPRLPGPPLARGLIFGVADAATAPTGGAFAFVKRFAPGLQLPFEWVGTQLVGRGSPAAHVAYGLGLGLVYRSRSNGRG